MLDLKIFAMSPEPRDGAGGLILTAPWTQASKARPCHCHQRPCTHSLRTLGGLNPSLPKGSAHLCAGRGPHIIISMVLSINKEEIRIAGGSCCSQPLRNTISVIGLEFFAALHFYTYLFMQNRASRPARGCRVLCYT